MPLDLKKLQPLKAPLAVAVTPRLAAADLPPEAPKAPLVVDPRARRVVEVLLNLESPEVAADTVETKEWTLREDMEGLIEIARNGRTDAARMRARAELRKLMKEIRDKVGLGSTTVEASRTLPGGETQTVRTHLRALEQVRRAAALIQSGLAQHKLELYDREETVDATEQRPPPNADEGTRGTTAGDAGGGNSVPCPEGEVDSQAPASTKGAFSSIPPEGHTPPSRHLPGGGVTGIPPGATAAEYGTDRVVRPDPSRTGTGGGGGPKVKSEETERSGRRRLGDGAGDRDGSGPQVAPGSGAEDQHSDAGPFCFGYEPEAPGGDGRLPVAPGGRGPVRGETTDIPGGGGVGGRHLRPFVARDGDKPAK